jgi:rhamnose utilization protein RhaD (predicted bifunctional aldolase and dehydrogenase)/NAD(P)-dependent dehydrogenase (short-subunit alcohol dehydrogenase family)
MNSLWNDEEAQQCRDDLALRVYTSRLLGRDKALVLHGGGNTSVKIEKKNLFGEPETILYVKGSGWDLETIEAAGFSPVRLDHVQKLAKLPVLSDPDMVNELTTHMLRANAPAPSIETILHGCLPYRFVDHTHADAVLAVSNTASGEQRIRDIYGDRCVVIPYLMPGFDLARYCAEAFAREKTPVTIGMVLQKHGIFSFGETARESYERMIELVSMAEDYLHQHGAAPRRLPAENLPTVAAHAQADLRRAVSGVAGAPMVMRTVTDGRSVAFARHRNCGSYSQRGPITPDHIIRTKRVPMLGTDVEAYASEYGKYFAANEPRARERKSILDQAPRVALDSAFGMVSFGRSARDAQVVAELYEHTMDVITAAEALGGFEPLGQTDLFEVEYWDLEQAKLKKAGKPAVFAGEIALVTGAASGIGKAAVDSLLARGAAVLGLDINPAVETLHRRVDYLGIACDLTHEAKLAVAIDSAVLRFGGLDMAVLNAGIFGASSKVAELDIAEWHRVMAINLDANLVLLRLLHPYLKLAPRGGRVAVIGSKNVPAPGPGAAAYSASKAALNQLVRVAALEWGADGIRINSLHPNAVFDTGLWTDEVLEQRARHYGLSVAQYKTRNIMKVEISSRDVAELAAELCGPLFAKTTAAQIPVDGGDDRVI